METDNRHQPRNRVIGTLFLVIVLILGLSPLFLWSPIRIDHLYRKHFGLPEGIKVGNLDVGGRFISEVRELLLLEAEKEVRWPQAATIDKHGVVTPEYRGCIFDVDATIAKIRSAKAFDIVEPVLLDLAPRLTASELFSLKRALGTYSTIINGTEDRRQNIRIAGTFINYTLLLPMQVFSFNRTVGAPTPERGFREAPVIIKEEIVPGYGGGICQVSSTLYNAVLKANLQVVERFSHSKQVTYVPPGQDATVAYDYMDFKFKNNRNHPILVRVWVWGRKLQVTIYGPAL